MRFVEADHSLEWEVWEGRTLEVEYRYCKAVEGEVRRILAGEMERHIDPAEELHIALAVEFHTVLEAGLHMVVVGEHRKAAEEVHHMAAVEGIDLEGQRRKAVVEDSLAEEDIDWEEGRHKAVEGDSLAEGEDIGRSLAAGNLRAASQLTRMTSIERTYAQAAERHRVADIHLDCKPFRLLSAGNVNLMGEVDERKQRSCRIAKMVLWPAH